MCCVPATPTGTIGTPVRMASSAAPARPSASRPSRLRVPSGKRPSASPCSSVASARRCADRSPAPRRTKMTPRIARQPAGDRPAAHLLLGHEVDDASGAMPHRPADGRRVQVRAVVGDHQHRAGARDVLQPFDPYRPDHPEQPAGRLPRRGGRPRSHQSWTDAAAAAAVAATRAGRCRMISSIDASTLSSPVSITRASCALRSGATARSESAASRSSISCR